MAVVETHKNYLLEWVDDEKTMLRLIIEPGWTWEIAAIAVASLDREIASVKHGIYSIYQFQPGAGKLPKFSAPNIRRILSNEMPNERLAILIGTDGYMMSVLTLVERVYGYLASNAGKVRVVNDFDEALQLIEADKAASAPQASNG